MDKPRDKSRENKKSPAQQRAEEAADIFYSEGKSRIKSDVSGSYTGTSSDGSPPEQDADDL